MNDRVSAAPPADFLDEGTSTADYERQFAMDWKPPELRFGSASGNGGGDNGYSNIAGNRNSFMSVNSGLSAFTTRTGAGAAASTTTSNKTSRGLLGKVREKLSMQKSRSSWAVAGAEDGDDNDTDKNSSWANFPIPPVFKHKRSESMDPSSLRANNRSSGSNSSSNNNNINNQPTTDFDKFQQNAAARAGARRPAPPVRADSLMASLPSFDPTKRPTREEITANYQSLLASGFFGTHAIQSTRFSPPGANTKRQNEASPEALSLAQRMEDEEPGQTGANNFPPSPERQPPPPPPPNREPPPPPPEMAMDVEEDGSASSTPTAIPASSTAVFSPLPPPRTSSRGSDTTMSPPPLPKQRQQKQSAVAFASVPYSSTRAGAEPILTARPYRPPPVSLARFSVDSSRPRSIDVQSFARGTKRPFSSGPTNGSQTSFYTHRSSYDYDPMAMDGHGGIGVATTTAEERVESGPRKLVKRLRKSASKLSFRSNNNSTKFGGAQGNDDAEDGGELQQPSTRTSMSSTVRRSFSWRLGASKPETSSQPNPSTNSSGIHNFGGFKSAGGSDKLSLNNSTNTSMDSFQPPPPPAPTLPPPSPPRGLPSIAASPSSADRTRLKKREIRTRRLRRKEESLTPTKASSQQPMQEAMDWQHPPSPSKRPRRSDASIFLRALNSNPVTMVEEDSGSEPEMPVPVVAAAAAAQQPSEQQQISLPPADGMEGVEFSFHFPGRTRPTSTPANGLHLGGPLAVVPDVNRGMPSVGSAFQGFGAKKTGSVRVVRGDLV